MFSNFKLIFFGFKQHGKDTACEYLRDKYGLTFASSSRFACDLFLFDELNSVHGFNYASPLEAYDDRTSPENRVIWFNGIKNYNAKDPGRLGRKIFLTNDVYNGIRDDIEFFAVKKEHKPLSVWIDASDRMPPESLESNKLNKNHADIVITNNTTKEDFFDRLDKFYETVLYPHMLMEQHNLVEKEELKETLVADNSYGLAFEM